MQEASSVRSFTVLHTLLSVRHFPYQAVSASYDMDDWDGAVLPVPEYPSCWWQAPLVLVADTPCAEGSHACPVTVRLQNKAGWRLAPGGEAGHKRRDKGRRKVSRFSYIALYPAVNKLFADPAAVSFSLLRLLCRERPLFVFIWLDIRFRLVLCR